MANGGSFRCRQQQADCTIDEAERVVQRLIEEFSLLGLGVTVIDIFSSVRQFSE